MLQRKLIPISKGLAVTQKHFSGAISRVCSSVAREAICRFFWLKYLEFLLDAEQQEIAEHILRAAEETQHLRFGTLPFYTVRK